MEVSGHIGTQILDIVQKSLAQKFVDSSCAQYIKFGNIWTF